MEENVVPCKDNLGLIFWRLPKLLHGGLVSCFYTRATSEYEHPTKPMVHE